MKKIRTLIVDDEPLARARISNLLRHCDDIQVVGEGKNGREALEMVSNYRPDLLFLDIQMPDLSGFEVLARSRTEDLPFIIFVTAYDQYALRAFDVHAVDYLLKPYDDERFLRALDHARQHIQLRQQALLHQKMLRLIEENLGPAPDTAKLIEIRDRGATYPVRIDDIHYVEAHGNYLKIHLANQYYLLRQTLQSLSDEINQPFFLRIHRSILINTHYIDRIRYQGNNQYLFLMRGSRELLSSRSHKEEIDGYLQDEALRKKLDGGS